MYMLLLIYMFVKKQLGSVRKYEVNILCDFKQEYTFVALVSKVVPYIDSGALYTVYITSLSRLVHSKGLFRR